MAPTKSPQVKVACLSCRSFKTRCDGQQPCANCSNNQRECQYRPSRRGGARRGERYQNAKRQRAKIVTNLLPEPLASPGTSDTFADDIASLLYPFHPLQGDRNFASTDVAETLSPAVSHGATSHSGKSFCIRSYHHDQDLLNAYYIFIHPYLPLLPPPEFQRYADNAQSVFLTSIEPSRSSLQFWPTSPFGLALMALLVLLPLPDDSNPMQEDQTEFRKAYSKFYADAALESIEDFSSYQDQSTAAPVSTPGIDEAPRSSMHPGLPSTLEPLLALLLLGVYEYCQNGNRRRMRSRIYNALILAMDLSLHIAGAAESANRALQSRVWWITMFLVYQSAIFNHSSPIVLLNDSRITTPFPDFNSSQKLWPTLMRAQEAMLRTGVIAKEMREGRLKGSQDSIRRRVCELDSFILSVIADLDQLPESQKSGADAVAILNMWHMARFLAYTARIKLHRFRAFGDHPVFLDKFCDLSSINSALFSDIPLSIPPDRFSESNSVFPFTEEESTQICLKGALVLSRTLRAIPWPNPSYIDASTSPNPFKATESLGGSMMTFNRILYPRSLPYMACCGMQCCYVLMMLLRRIRSLSSTNNLTLCRYLLGHTEPETERQDIERFIEELRHGVKSVWDFMSSNAVFGGVVDMAREVEAIYIAHFDD